MSIEQLISLLEINESLKTKLNQGKYISLENVDNICEALDIPVEKVILYKKGEQQGAIKVKVNWNKLIEYADSKSLGLSTISTLIHLDRTYLSHAKSRDSYVPLDVIRRISILLKCNPDELEYKPSELEE